VYACYRPFQQFSEAELEKLKECVEQNNGTNHWATEIVHSGDFKRRTMSDNIKVICSNPSSAYDILKWRPSRDCFIINGKEQRRLFEEQQNQVNGAGEVIKERKRKIALKKK